MKKIVVLALALIGLSGCATGNFDAYAEERPEKIHDAIAPGNFQQVNIRGSASSMIIRPSASGNFEFYNGDLNLSHTYTVRCDENGETLDIEIMMENPDGDNDVLGSVWIDIPEKEFEQVEIDGDFQQVSLPAIPSDVLIHANDSAVNLDLEADSLDHNITLTGSDSNAFSRVSVSFDRLPDDIRLDLNGMQGGTIDDPQGILSEQGFEAGSGEPVIRIDHAKEIHLSCGE